MDLSQLIKECQDAVGVTVDGKPGPQTWAAIHARLLPSHADSLEAAAEEPVDDRSEKNIATLHPRVQPYARALIHAAIAKGWTFKITSGLRTYAEQDKLYTYGRTVMNPDGPLPGKPRGATVTNAVGGYSNHNFGIAFDVTLFDGAQPVYDSPLYKGLAVLGTQMGLEWGGSWQSINDQPHYQLRPHWAKDMPEKVMLTELRRRKTAKLDAFA
jgi:peptidoglycan L-alanyl-D-glutamate endopeptidase CwlK